MHWCALASCTNVGKAKDRSTERHYFLVELSSFLARESDVLLVELLQSGSRV